MEPFGFINFHASTFKLERYAKMILNEGLAWIGCRNNPPIIWYPLDGYQSNYELCKKEEDVAFEVLKGKHGFRRPG
jgi:hypothetical protein